MTISTQRDQDSNYSQADLIALIPQMRAFARSLCRDRTQADDLTQEALTSAWRRRDSYAPGSNLRAWVFMILRNQFYSDKRRSWRVLPLDPRVAEGTLVAATNPTSALELDEVRRAMLQLTDEQREALTLVAVAGLAYADAATICACAVGTMKSRVGRARQRLAAILAVGDLVGEPQNPGDAMASIFADAGRARVRSADLSAKRLANARHALGGTALSGVVGKPAGRHEHHGQPR
jgi:RNA polymerase sigma-70 factor (ECF subfamily)